MTNREPFSNFVRLRSDGRVEPCDRTDPNFVGALIGIEETIYFGQHPEVLPTVFIATFIDTDDERVKVVTRFATYESISIRVAGHPL